MIPASNEIVLTLFGNQWIETIPILKILAVAVPFNLVSSIPAIMCDSIGKLNEKLFIQLLHPLFLIVFIILFYHRGIIFLAGLVVIAECLRFLAFNYLAHRFLRVSFQDVLHAYLPSILSSLLVLPCITLVRMTFYNKLLVPALLFLEIATGATILFMIIAFKPPQRLQQTILKVFSAHESNNTGISKFLFGWYSKK
jgi:PST family polysaccharide transporter